MSPTDPFDDFRNVVILVWKCLGLPRPTPVQLDVAKALQDSTTDRHIIMGFRGLAKTYLTVVYALDRLRRDPEEKILVVSAGQSFADQVSQFAYRLLDLVPLFHHLKPGAGQKSSAVAFDVAPARPSKDPSLKSVGIFGQVTGSRASLILGDDLETPRTCETVGQREKLRNRVTEEFASVLKPGGQVILLGTAHSEDSIYPWLVRERGYTLQAWPARARVPAGLLPEQLGPYVASLEPGSLVDPTRFDAEELRRREVQMGPTHFRRQFLLDIETADSGLHPLRLSDLIVMPLDPEVAPEKVVYGTANVLDIPCYGFTGDRYHGPLGLSGGLVPYEGAVMFVDPSGRGKDETAWAVVKILGGQLFCTAAGGSLAGYEKETMETIADVAASQRVPKILVEDNFGDGMFVELLRPYLRKWPCQIETVRATGKKELRICDTLEPIMAQHRLIIDEGVLRADAAPRPGLAPEKAAELRLAYQIAHITRTKGCLVHDDRLDALAGACRYWADYLGRTADEAMEKRRQEALAEELRAWDAEIGVKTNDTWLSGFDRHL